MPPRAVLDTSVLVPRWSRGVLRRLALLDPPPYRPIWSTAIVAELWRVLAVQRLGRGDSATAMGAAAHAMWQWPDPVMAIVPASAPPPGAPPAPMRDPRDEHLWNAAVTAGARYIVSHNTRDFPPPTLVTVRAAGDTVQVARHVYHDVEFLTAIEFGEDVLGEDAAAPCGRGAQPPVPQPLTATHRGARQSPPHGNRGVPGIEGV